MPPTSPSTRVQVLPPVAGADGQPQAAPSEEPLGWLPPTLPALTLRLLSLDASILFRAGAPPGRDSLAGYKYTVRPAPLDAQPAVVAAASAGGKDAADAAPPASAVLPMAVGGGAVVLTNGEARGEQRGAIYAVRRGNSQLLALRLVSCRIVPQIPLRRTSHHSVA